MINIEFNNLEERIWINSNNYFNWTLDLKYRETDFSKKVVSCVDKSKVINKFSVDSPYLGVIPYENISTGAKTLICMKYTDKFKFGIFNMGSNCFNLIPDIADNKDIYLITNNVERFYKYTVRKDYKIRIVNTDVIVDNDIDLSEELFMLHEAEYNR